MEIKALFDKLEKDFNNYKAVIGLAIIILLGILIVLTVQNFDKQNQIIEKGGFTDGKIKCVCNQDAWNQYMTPDNLLSLNVSSNISEDLNNG